ncbi:hypothetical protein JL720_15624 [Aureococcus anophagefferens]|nr:hypothetical protein JL720_15624 [Aureococcus anophagefferens]
MRSLAKAVAKAAGVERVVLEADGGVLDGAAKVSAVLRDGQRLVAAPLDLPYDEFDVVVVDFGRAGAARRRARRRRRPGSAAAATSSAARRTPCWDRRRPSRRTREAGRTS